MYVSLRILAKNENDCDIEYSKVEESPTYSVLDHGH